jgi:predicted nucleic acid-binding protein
MASVRYLVDATALIAMAHTGATEALSRLCAAGHTATCGVVDLRLRAALRDLVDLPQLAALRQATFVWLPTLDEDMRRALEVQAQLAVDGYRPAEWSTLLVAAVAERHSAAVLHHSTDFERIAKISRQATEWAVPDDG